MNPKYPDIEVPLSGEDGNVFFIIGRTTRAMRNAGIPANEIEEFCKEVMSGNYDHALQTVMKWVSTS